MLGGHAFRIANIDNGIIIAQQGIFCRILFQNCDVGCSAVVLLLNTDSLNICQPFNLILIGIGIISTFQIKQAGWIKQIVVEGEMESRLQGCRSVQPSFCINRNYAENNTNTRIFRKKSYFIIACM